MNYIRRWYLALKYNVCLKHSIQREGYLCRECRNEKIARTKSALKELGVRVRGDKR